MASTSSERPDPAGAAGPAAAGPKPIAASVTAQPPSSAAVLGPEMVTVTIDGKAHQFPKGTNLLEACNQVGANVPFFCYHPGLSAPAVCRQCMVEIKGQPKPVPSCYTPVADKMEVQTASEKALDVRRQMLEFTLLNHPIDCPICDKAGECLLQKHYFDWDAKYARNDGIKVHKAKTVDVGKHIVLDQERCILCTRCVRVCDEVGHSQDLLIAQRGDHAVLTTAPGRRLDNPYSLNTVDVCPVGALTSKDFRFAMRAWELYATPSVCPGCATGCNVEVHTSRGKTYRLVPRENLKVNKFWMCDEGRFTYKPLHAGRAAVPQIGGTPVEWDRALAEAGAKLRPALDAHAKKVAVVLSAQACNEDNHALARLAFDHLQLDRAYLAAAADGWSDDNLVSADKNPNTAGAKAIGGAKLRTLKDLADDIRSGAVRALLSLGGDLGTTVEAALPGLDAVVVLSTHTAHAAQAAHVLLPMAAWAEIDGTFTNKLGMVQRIRAGIPPAGDALPAWDVLCHLARKLGATMDFDGAKAVFTEAKAKHEFMKDAEWGRPMLPVQLRFAESRG